MNVILIVFEGKCERNKNYNYYVVKGMGSWMGVYRVAAYVRLSREKESESIRSQKEFISAYVKKQDNMKIYDFYADEGYSGTNFERPEFQRMMRDVKSGNVDCIIVKDLSRLGRDYIEVGRLIQKIFPAFFVRFIAITDNYDSFTADFNETSLIIPLKNFVNDSYAGDISAKVRSHQKIKRENGDFIGAFAMYGYKKSEKNRNRLVPDKYASKIVKRIFLWKMEGYSNLAIAFMLEEMGVLCPYEYKKINGENFQSGFAGGFKAKWSAVAVKRILTNESYVGTLVQGKEEKINYKVNKSIKKPESEWVKIKDAHMPIIEKEDFRVVQRLLGTDIRSGAENRRAHKYAGLLFCGDCGKPMIRRINHYKGKEYAAFICSRKNKNVKCGRHTLSEGVLDEILLTEIRQLLALYLNCERYYLYAGKLKRDRVGLEEFYVCFCEETERMWTILSKYRKARDGIEEDMKKGYLGRDTYESIKKVYESYIQETAVVMKRREKGAKKIFLQYLMAQRRMERLEKEYCPASVERALLISFVRRIRVYEDKRVWIEFCKGMKN